jgi:hypothetical protein
LRTGAENRNPHDIEQVPRELLVRLRRNRRRRHQLNRKASEAQFQMVELLREVRAGGFNMREAADAIGVARTYAWQITQNQEEGE